MDGQYCFMCGAATVAQASRAVPVCAECRARRTGDEAEVSEWMVQRPGARARGPMTREAVLLGIARERVGMDDQVGRIGSHPVALCEHPEFRACFIPGSADEQRISELQADNRAGITRARRQRWARRTVAGLGLCGTVAVTYVGLSTRTFILPGPTLDELRVGWKKVAAAVDTDNAMQETRIGLPHEEWVQGLAGAAPATEVHWTVLLQQARADIWRGDVPSVARARTSLHQVLAQNPDDPVAIAALAEATAAQAGRDAGWLASATRAANRADASGKGSTVANRAMAALALAEGNDTLAIQLTEECAQDDLGCRIIGAEAKSDIDPLEREGGLHPESARIQLALGRTALAQGSWATLERTASAAVVRWPESGAAWALLAEAQAATGRWQLSKAAAEQAITQDPWRLKSRHLQGAVELWTGNPQVAKEAYSALMAQPAFENYARRVECRVQGGIAALRTGDLVQAAEWADAAQADIKTHTGAMLLRSAVELASKQEIEAKAVLREIDHSLLSGHEGARMHYWAGVLFLDMGQQRLARSELEAAATADPHWGAPRLELAWAKLDSGNVQGASEAIRELGWMDPRLGRVVDLRTRVDLGDPSLRPWRSRLEKAMSGDVRLALKKPGTLAVLDWYAGRPGSVAGLSGAIAAGDSDLDLQAALAQALVRDGQWESAVEVTDRVLGSRARAGLFHAVRGHATHKLERAAESAASFARALKYAGDHPTVLWWAFDARWASGDIKGSQMVIEAIRSLEIDGPRVAGVRLAQVVPKE